MTINTNSLRWSILILSICVLLKAIYNIVYQVKETVFNQSILSVILILLVIAIIIIEIVERYQKGN